MGAFTRSIVHIRGLRAAAPLLRAIKDPARAQTALLRRLLQRNADTAFGRKHGFDRISTVQDYTAAVPIRDYEYFRPYIDQINQGEEAILTRDQPLMFTTTSGTTAEPKLLPVTKQWKQDVASMMRVWLYWASRDHKGLFNGSSLSIVSPAIEGQTSMGQDFGAMSGLAYQRVPWVVRRNYAIPYEAMTIADYEDRYFACIRLALSRDVSVIALPNPSTLVRLAQLAERRAEEIIRAIHDGRLGLATDHLVGEGSKGQRAVYHTLEQEIVPDPERASELEKAADQHGRLLPRYAWPNLKLIGCWLGGSCGVQAERLGDLYGPNVPLRDLGLRASEATVTIPFDDETAAGVLALHANFYEFIPEEAIDEKAPITLSAHELEQDRNYYLVLTTKAGLYRYDINDIVRVVGFLKRAPVLSFIRKGRDMASITGEKLHVMQVISAMAATRRLLPLEVTQYRMIPDVDASRYDLLLEVAGACQTEDLLAFVDQFDSELAKANIEYAQKRSSGRLGGLRVHLMNKGWAEKQWRADVARGKRDSQYKWPYIQLEWNEDSRQAVARTFTANEMRGEAEGERTLRKLDNN